MTASATANSTASAKPPASTKSSAPAATSLEQIVEEHKALADSVDRLEKSTDPHQVLPRLEKLRGQLVHHFEGEEAPGGLRADVRRSAPYLLPSVEKVFSEHREFLDEIDALHDKAEALLRGPLAEILDGVTVLTRKLRDHEMRESELLSDVYYNDYGSAD